VRAKALLALANVWLLLGSAERALDLLPPTDAGWITPLRVQWHWAQARVASMQGRPADRHLQAMGEIQAAHWTAPLSQSSWLDWSRPGRRARGGRADA